MIQEKITVSSRFAETRPKDAPADTIPTAALTFVAPRVGQAKVNCLDGT